MWLLPRISQLLVPTPVKCAGEKKNVTVTATLSGG